MSDGHRVVMAPCSCGGGAGRSGRRAGPARCAPRPCVPAPGRRAPSPRARCFNQPILPPRTFLAGVAFWSTRVAGRSMSSGGRARARAPLTPHQPTNNHRGLPVPRHPRSTHLGGRRLFHWGLFGGNLGQNDERAGRGWAAAAACLARRRPSGRPGRQGGAWRRARRAAVVVAAAAARARSRAPFAPPPRRTFFTTFLATGFFLITFLACRVSVGSRVSGRCAQGGPRGERRTTARALRRLGRASRCRPTTGTCDIARVHLARRQARRGAPQRPRACGPRRHGGTPPPPRARRAPAGTPPHATCDTRIT